MMSALILRAVVPVAEEFHYRINGGETQNVSTATGIYMYAALQVTSALLASEAAELPIDIEIWSRRSGETYGPYRYRLAEDEYGALRLRYMVYVTA